MKALRAVPESDLADFHVLRQDFSPPDPSMSAFDPGKESGSLDRVRTATGCQCIKRTSRRFGRIDSIDEENLREAA